MFYTFSAKVWKYNSPKASWFFVTIPKEIAYKIKLENPLKGEYGTVKIVANIGTVRWKTSIFPDKKLNSYILPLKKEIRTKLYIEEEDEINISIEISSSFFEYE